MTESLDQNTYEDAVKQLVVSCNLKAEQNDYTAVSVRHLLSDLGFRGDMADAIIRRIAKGGFSYCLDPIILWADPDDKSTSYPVPSVCVWEPTQIASRLRCLDNLPTHELPR
jgi:hypothetical protein